jgi:hypothetical protein
MTDTFFPIILIQEANFLIAVLEAKYNITLQHM